MPIIKCQNFIEVYRHKAGADALHEMSGRSGRPDLTRFIAEQIIKHMDFASGDRVVDIGCGDGTLMMRTADQVSTVTGILPTAEEVARLSNAIDARHGNLSIRQGTVQLLPCKDTSADKLICNGVLLLLADADVDVALAEMCRVARPGALIYIGEIPTVDEFASRPYGDSILRWLLWSIRYQSLAVFARNCHQVMQAMLSRTPLIITPKHHFHTTPEAFIERARLFELHCVANHPHPEIDPDGTMRQSPTRWDYLFRLKINT